MHPVLLQANAEHHINALHEIAAAERLAALQRGAHRNEHAAHAGFDHRHGPSILRRTVGHALIELGAAIAGGSGSGARRAA